MTRLALLAVLLLSCLNVPSPLAHAAPAHEVTLSGGDLPHPVRLALSDADAFRRRLQRPPKLDEEPVIAGSGYRLTTLYWDEVLRNGRSDREPAEAAATYFENGGYVRARQGGEDVWLALDLRQRAIIDRYLRLTRAGLLNERPGVLEVLEVASRGERIGVDIGGSQLSPVEARELWAGLAVSPGPSFRDQPQQPATTDSGAWLIFSLEEGRSVQVIYDPATRTLTDFYGSETYRVIPPVAFTIESVMRGGGSGLTIEQQSGRGSSIWWLIMLGVGIAGVATAVWLNRRLRPASAD